MTIEHVLTMNNTKYFGIMTRVGIYILVLFVPLTFIPFTYDMYRLPKEALYQIVVIFLLLIFLLKNSLHCTTRLYKTPINLPFNIFVIISLLSLTKATNIYDGIEDAQHLLIGFLLFYVIINNYKIAPSVSKIANISVLCGGIVSIIGLYQYSGGGISWLAEAVPPASTFGHRNMGAAYLIFVIPMAIYKLLISKNFRSECLYITTLFLMTTYLVFTFCRGAWVGIAGGTLLFAVTVIAYRFCKRNDRVDISVFFSKRKIYLLFSTLIAVGIFSQIPKSSNVVEKELLNIKGGTGQTRLIFWKNTSMMIFDNALLGVGLGNFKINYPKYWQAVEPDVEANEHVFLPHPHNDFIEIMAETGLLGFVAFCLLLFSVFKTAAKCIKEGENRVDILTVIILCYGIINSLGRGLLGFPLKMPTTSLLFWFYFALIGVEYLKHKEKHGDIRYLEVSTGPKYLLVLPSILFLSLISFNFINKIRADYHFFRAISYSDNKLPNLAKMEILETVRLNPYGYNGQIIAANLNTSLKNYKDAEIYANNALKLRPYTPYALDMLGFIYSNSGKMNEGIELYKKALSLKSDFITPRYRLALAYKQQGKFSRALEEFETILTYDPKHSDSRKMIGQIAETFQHELFPPLEKGD